VFPKFNLVFGNLWLTIPRISLVIKIRHCFGFRLNVILVYH